MRKILFILLVLTFASCASKRKVTTVFLRYSGDGSGYEKTNINTNRQTLRQANRGTYSSGNLTSSSTILTYTMPGSDKTISPPVMFGMRAVRCDSVWHRVDCDTSRWRLYKISGSVGKFEYYYHRILSYGLENNCGFNDEVAYWEEQYDKSSLLYGWCKVKDTIGATSCFLCFKPALSETIKMPESLR